MAKMTKVLYHERRVPKCHRIYIISAGAKSGENAKGKLA
ncbi:hypothetical protein COLO4_08974 [Corchorus olitorius]|uniref:Uncharacterized protein n=1 Tax=Corchorus olitorius TaxID=93759 RepID=A0A1R3KDX5_9ROSI|nr:hypothetical protein COLO4_08974 [Corchorus olitorius]